MRLPLAQGFYQSESKPLSSQECVNFYPSIPETKTITEANVFQTPGLELTADAGALVTNRGAINFDDQPYFVNGGNLYRLDRTVSGAGVETFNLVSVGVIPGTKRVSLSTNGDQLCIVIPELSVQFNAYIYTTAGGLVQISDVDFDGPASAVTFVDGYFVFTKKDGNIFFISALRDGFSYNALDTGTAESDPDPIQAPVVYRNQLIIFGSKTLESFQNVGGADFPFIRTGVVERKGVFARSTLVESDGFLFWIGGTSREKPQVLVYSGSRPETISTRAVEFQLAKFTREEIEDAFAWEYSEDGATFIGFTVSSITFVYDLSTQVWHTRASDDVNGDRSAFRISQLVEAYGALYVGDIQNGNIGRMSRDVLQEYGVDIKRRVVLPPIDSDGERVFLDYLELLCDTGTTTSLTPAQVRLSWSDDGGYTFSDPLSRDLGETGSYSTRVFWNQLGSFPRSRMIALEMNSPVRTAFIKLEAGIG